MTQAAATARPLVDLGRPIVAARAGGGSVAPAAGLLELPTPRCSPEPPTPRCSPEPRTARPPRPRAERASVPAPATAAPVEVVPAGAPVTAPAPAGPRPGRRRVARAGRRALELSLTLFVGTSVLLFLALVVGPRTGAYQTTTMLTGSMAPALPAGSLLVDRPVHVADVRPGDVVTLEAPTPGRPVFSHRVVAVEVSGGRPALRTKGDANADVDPWLAVPEGDTVWVVRAAVPAAGTAIRWLRSPGPRSVLVVGVPAVLLVWGLLLVWRDPDEEPAGGPA